MKSTLVLGIEKDRDPAIKHVIRTQRLMLLSMLLLITSCTKYISMYPLPELTGGSPLRGVQQTSFIVNDFEDQRLEKEYIGVIGGDMVKAKEDLSKVLTDALTKELERNGHLINLADSSNNVNLIIDGCLYDYYCVVLSGFWKVVGNAKVESEITVTDSNTKEIKLKKKYVGFYEASSAWGISLERYQELLNEALKNMIKEFTMDTEFLNSLQFFEK